LMPPAYVPGATQTVVPPFVAAFTARASVLNGAAFVPAAESLPLVAAKPLQSFVRVGRPLTERVVASASVSLPVAKGAVLGHVEVWSGDRLLGRRALVASRAVSSPGAAGRIGWYAKRTVHDALGLFS